MAVYGVGGECKAVVHCEVVSVGVPCMERLPSLLHLELQVSKHYSLTLPIHASFAPQGERPELPHPHA